MVESGQLAHMDDIHLRCAEYCSRRKGEPDWEMRVGFLEEVMPDIRKGAQSSAGIEKGWAPWWVGGRRKHSKVDGIQTAWHEDTGLAIVRVQLEVRERTVTEGVWWKS